MGRISLLPADLANQIAAGEVVERPASVVKELVENAIDAGARRIAIHVELGGKKQVRVDDDGEGMDPGDVRLAIERHATSKIRQAGDLAAILTHGFRGEALPSIASVSHFVLRSRTRDRDSGTEVRVNGGLVAAEIEVPAATGTVVEVNDLFYNLPARRKFLKSDGAETAQVSRITTQLALAYPEIGFTLTSGPRSVLQCPPAATLKDRLYQLYGDRGDLLEVRKEAGGVRMFGFIAALAEQGPTRGPQNVFINRRIVKDRTIAHAIIDAYSMASIKERSPEVHLFLEMAADALDVNVHPTKAEVRFREQSLVHEVVRRGLMDALGAGGVPELQLQQESALARPFAPSIPGILGGGTFPNRWVPGATPQAPYPSYPNRPYPEPGPGPGQRPVESGPGSTVGVAAASPAGVAGSAPDVRPMIPLGQFRDTFIIAIDDEGVAIIDQHVAHERVLFERVMQQLTRGDLESQRLLVPLLMDVSASAQQTLIDRAAALSRLGYDVEAFGEGTIRVSAVPAVLSTEDSAQALIALADDLEGLDRGGQVQDALQRIAATTACHAAVKANYPLTYEKMTHILEELRATAYSTVCPHGRPVMLRITKREIERNFDRI
ncbi:MAG TPA: DNA mismatch repair endonuclease MutL [Vicinamibacterales bacterium]|nr:DNA mismatch repair endonuclease MutL [Vicinamibacterales bacterium]